MPPFNRLAFCRSLAGVLIELQTLLKNRSIIREASALAAGVDRLASPLAQSRPATGKEASRQFGKLTNLRYVAARARPPVAQSFLVSFNLVDWSSWTINKIWEGAATAPRLPRGGAVVPAVPQKRRRGYLRRRPDVISCCFALGSFSLMIFKFTNAA